MTTPITRALISVSDKQGLVPFAQFLAEQGVILLSTGGTAATLRDAGLSVVDVSEVTGAAEMMDGRVKTLHPNIHGGLLADRDNDAHIEAMQAHGIEGIDLLVVNLYPFEQTVARGAAAHEVIENIDIGGPAMIRAAAKNHAHVAVVSDVADYDVVQKAMQSHDNHISLDVRRMLAAKAFTRTAAYDSAISQWFAAEGALPAASPYIAFGGTLKQALRYGENPHQAANFYVSDSTQPGIASAVQLQGKELSYNNLNDTDAAFQLVAEFTRPSVAIIKHANPCGVASADSQLVAFENALACDPVSAYGGILAVNELLDMPIVEAILAKKLFLEVIIAPAISDAAKQALSARKNLRLLETGAMPDVGSETDAAMANMMVKSVAGGLLVQNQDRGRVSEDSLRLVTQHATDADELRDMVFAFRVCKHVKSNAIIFAKGEATVGIGAGQMSRIDAVRIARWKAEAAGLSTVGSVLASDAFFPFDDNVHAAHEAGVRAIIQPGGSIRDEEIIAATDEHGMAMMFTGMRHFRH